MRAHKIPKTDRWRVWLNLGTDPATGQRIRKKIEGKTKRDTEIKARAIKERFERGENVRDKPRTTGELLDEWLATVALQGKTDNTLVAYRSAIKNHLKPRLGNILVPQLRTREIQIVFNDLADRLKPATVGLAKTVLVSALNFAIGQHPPEVTVNAAKTVRTPKATRTPGRSLTPDEVRAVLVACEGHRYGPAIKLALMGLRRSELPGLRWEDFDEQSGTLNIRRQAYRDRAKKRWTTAGTKDDSDRMLSLGPKMTAELRQYRWNQADERDAMEWPNSGYIFISAKTGGICPPGTIADAFKDICRAAGIEPARLHDCRHTAATKLLSEGEDIATVADVLGHASPQVTAMVYAHALPHKVANASRRLEGLYDGETSQDDTDTRRRHE